MNLHNKALLWSSIITAIVAMTIGYGLGFLMLQRYTDLEIQHGNEEMYRPGILLKQEISNIALINRDWAQWDVTYNFIKNPNPKFIQSNFPENILEQLNLNLMVVIKQDGNILINRYSTPGKDNLNIPLTSELKKYLSPGSSLVPNKKTSETRQGILNLPSGLMLVVSQSITKSNGKGVPLGTLVFGRYITESYIKQLGINTGIKINIQSWTKANISDAIRLEIQNKLRHTSELTYVLPTHHDELSGFALLPDIDNHPAVFIQAQLPRTMHSEVISFTRLMGVLIFLSGLIIGLSQMVLLERLVLKRLSRLHDDLHTIAQKITFRKRVTQDHYNDELTSVTSGINKVLDALEQSQAQVEISRQQLALYISCFPGYAFLKDNTGKALYLSNSFADLLQRPIEEIIGCNNDEIWPADYAKQVNETDLKVLETGEPVCYDATIEIASIRYQMTTYKFLISCPNADPLIAGFALDVTEQHEQAEELTLMLHGLAAIVKVADDLIAAPNQKELFRLALHFAQTGLNLKNPQFINCTEVINDDEQPITTLISQDKNKMTIALQTHPNASSNCLFVYDYLGDPSALYDTKYRMATMFCALLAHISEHKKHEEQLRQAESRLRAILNSIDEVVFLINEDSDKGYVAVPVAGIMQHHSFDDLAAGLIAHMGSQLEELKQTRQPQLHDYTVIKDGITHWYNASVAPFVDEEDQENVCFVAAIRDITGRKEIETQLQAALENLARSNTELEQFAYVASHDLQEPLRMVASYVQLLARRYQDKLDEDANDFIGYAVDGATRMQRLINDLLAYSRVGTQGRDLAPTDMSEVLNIVLQNLQIQIFESQAKITYDKLPVVLADEAQLIQLIQNLIGNALKFHGEEIPEIHIGLQDAPDEWRFYICDNGIGIDLAYAERIFIIFQRLHSRQEYSGTGIGLAICKRIVERHHGKIWVESKPGGGSTFWFTISKQEEVAN